MSENSLNTPEVRQRFIGGSDIAALLGLSRWKTQLQLWAEKTGQIVPKESDALHLRLGTRLEEVVAELFTEKTGKRVQRANERRIHPKYPFLCSQIDRLIVGEDEFLECKTASAWKAKEWAGEEIPQEYVLQVMHGLAVTGRKRAYLAVLIGNQDFIVKTVDRDPVLIADMTKRAVTFWNDFVIPCIMPGQVTARDAETLFALYPHEDPGTKIDLGDDGARLIESRNALYQDQIAVESQIDKIENEIKVKMGDVETAQAGKYRVTWKAQSSARCDTKKLKEEAPELYARYMKTTESRVLRIKENA